MQQSRVRFLTSLVKFLESLDFSPHFQIFSSLISTIFGPVFNPFLDLTAAGDLAKVKVSRSQFAELDMRAPPSSTTAPASVKRPATIFFRPNHLRQTSASSSVATTITASARRISSCRTERDVRTTIRIDSAFLESAKITDAISAGR